MKQRMFTKILIISAMPIVAFVMVLQVSAQTATDSSTTDIPKEKTLRNNAVKEEQLLKRKEAVEKRLSARAEQVRMRGEKEIDRRIASLTSLIERINNFKKTSDEQKTALSSQVQAEIANLQSLKTKISQDNDLEILKTDLESIKLSYRIYALFIPKIHVIGGTDTILNAANELTNVLNKLQTALQEAEAQGENVASLQAKLNTMQANISEAIKLAQAAQKEVLALIPEGFPENKSVLQNARISIRNAHKELVSAKQHARKVIQELKKTNREATSSSVPTNP